jgi:hypothetical protein
MKEQAEPVFGPLLDLANALSGDTHLLADLLERVFLVIQTVAEPDDLGVPGVELSKGIPDPVDRIVP